VTGLRGAAVAGLGILLGAAPSFAGGVMRPADPAVFCPRVHLQSDGQTLLLSKPVEVSGKTYKRKIRAGFDMDDGSDVFGEIMNYCQGLIARPPMAHNY
jgi:hypothetical protein